jgi:hypothetical protein
VAWILGNIFHWTRRQKGAEALFAEATARLFEAGLGEFLDRAIREKQRHESRQKLAKDGRSRERAKEQNGNKCKKFVRAGEGNRERIDVPLHRRQRRPLLLKGRFCEGPFSESRKEERMPRAIENSLRTRGSQPRCPLCRLAHRAAKKSDNGDNKQDGEQRKRGRTGDEKKAHRHERQKRSKTARQEQPWQHQLACEEANILHEEAGKTVRRRPPFTNRFEAAAKVQNAKRRLDFRRPPSFDSRSAGAKQELAKGCCRRRKERKYRAFSDQETSNGECRRGSNGRVECTGRELRSEGPNVTATVRTKGCCDGRAQRGDHGQQGPLFSFSLSRFWASAWDRGAA